MQSEVNQEENLNRIITVPNLLSFFRLCLIPVIIWSYCVKKNRSVDQQRGCCEVTEGKYEITIYTSCCNTAKGIYYYTTYDNHQITAVDMHAENLDSDQLICYPLLSKGEVRWQNK